MDIADLNTPIGNLEIKGNKEGVSSVYFLKTEEETTTKVPNSRKDTVKQLEEYFLGKRTEFHVKLHPEGTKFQKKVWHKLQEIPFSKTISYQTIANRLGDPN